MKDFELYLKSYLSPMRFRFIVLLVFIASSVFSQKKKNNFSFTLDTIGLDQFTFHQSFFKPAEENYFFKVPIKRYSGNPLKKTPQNLVYFNPAEELISYRKMDERVFSYTNFPNSILYYLDSSQVYSTFDREYLRFKQWPDKDFSEYTAPFYFSKNEVSNEEYDEFLNYILDSLVRKKIGGDFISIQKNDTLVNRDVKLNFKDSAVVKAYATFFHSDPTHFYRTNHINTEIFQYTLNGKSIPLYPDTISWTRNFPYWWITEPMQKMYFWHPVYKNYPVTGINYWQAKAFCNWKEKQLQKEFTKINPNLIIDVDLPSMLEWTYAIKKSFDYNDGNNLYPSYCDDQNFNTSLMLTQYDALMQIKPFYHIQQPLRKFLYGNSYTYGSLTIDGALETRPPIEKEKKPSSRSMEIMNSKEIQFMGNNLSEWTNHDYSQWSAIFTKRQQKLLDSKTEQDSIISKIEMLYDKTNDKKGKLVIGGNWFDEKHSLQLGQNLEGAYSKKFVHPDSSYCTVGFRYVVHVKLKNDTANIKKPLQYFPAGYVVNTLLENCLDWVVELPVEGVLSTYSGYEEIILTHKIGERTSYLPLCSIVTNWDDYQNTIKIKTNNDIKANNYNIEVIDQNTIKLTRIKDK